MEKQCLGERSAEKLQEFKARDRKRHHTLKLQYKRKSKVVALPQPIDVKEQKVFVEAGALGADDFSERQWTQAKIRSHLMQVGDRSAATVFVVSDPCRPGDRTAAVASIVGGLLATPGHFLDPSRGGLVLKLKPAQKLPRNIFVSAGTLSRHGPMVDLMRGIGAPSRWTWFGKDGDADKRRFLDLAKRRARCKKSSEMVTLVRQAEFKEFGKLSEEDDAANLPQQHLATR